MFGYVITWIQNGVRCMTFRNIDNNVYMLESVANKCLAMYREQMRGRYPDAQLDTMEIRYTETTPHGEAIGTVFKE